MERFMVKTIPKATITPDQLTLWEAPLQKVMQDMADDVLMNFIRHLMSQGTVTLSPINAYVWQLEKLRDFGLINQENIKIIAQYSGKTEAAINKLLINSGILVYNEARKEFEGNAPVAEVKEQLAAMANQTFLDINNIVNETLISTNGSGNVYQAYKEIIDKTVGEVFMGVLTPEKALRQTIQQWIAQRGGVGYFIDKGGHKWSFESYVNTVINSTSMRMYNEMRTQAARDYDIHTFYMSHHAAAREMCAPIQGHVVYDPRSGGKASDYSEYPNLSNYGLGTAGGTFGINCRHYLTPFIPGVNEMPSDKPVDPETAIKNGRKQAQQRQLERNVRNAKRDLKVAEAFGDDKAIMNAKLKIKRNQAALRQIVKDNDFLVRDYNREFFNVNNQRFNFPKKTKTLLNDIDNAKMLNKKYSGDELVKRISILKEDARIFNQAYAKRMDVDDLKSMEKAKRELEKFQKALAYRQGDYIKIGNSLLIGDTKKNYTDYLKDKLPGELKLTHNILENQLEHLYSIPELDFEKGLGRYTDNWAFDLNNWLRFGKDDELMRMDFNTSSLKLLKEQMSGVVLKEDITTYRGIAVWDGTPENFMDQYFGGHEIGAQKVDRGFASTSLIREKADAFAREGGDYGIVMKIKIPAGTNHGIYIDGRSRNSGEVEYLLSDGVKYKILDIKEVDDVITEVEVEAIFDGKT